MKDLILKDFARSDVLVTYRDRVHGEPTLPFRQVLHDADDLAERRVSEELSPGEPLESDFVNRPDAEFLGRGEF